MRVSQLLAHEAGSAPDDPAIQQLTKECCQQSKLNQNDIEINEIPGERLLDFHTSLNGVREKLRGGSCSSA